MGNPAFQLPAFDDAPARPLADDLLCDPAIAGILQSVRDHLGVEVAFVARYVENEQSEITHVSTDLDLPLVPGFREDREDSYCWHILQGRLPELIQDTDDHPLAQKLAITHALPVGCHVNTPLTLGDGTVWGSFCAMGRQPDHSMNPRDLAVLKSFADMARQRIETALERDADLRQARKRVEAMLDGHAVTMFQQPIHDLNTGKPVGVECLARFPDLNKRGPQAWFDDAARTGLGNELQMTAVRCALETVGQVPQGIYAAINASPATILSGDLRKVLEESGATNLMIEITDHQAVEDFDALAREVAAIKPFARIAIDNAGTGYKGLRDLAALHPDILKMDMVLTRECEHDPARRAIAAAMVQFSRGIGARVVAEGIETEQERAVMQELGVDYGQGYLFARPLPVVAAQQHLMGVSMEG